MTDKVEKRPLVTKVADAIKKDVLLSSQTLQCAVRVSVQEIAQESVGQPRHFLSGMLILPTAQITNSPVDGPGPITNTSTQARVQDVFVRQKDKNAFDTIKDDGISTDFQLREMFNANFD